METHCPLVPSPQKGEVEAVGGEAGRLQGRRQLQLRQPCSRVTGGQRVAGTPGSVRRRTAVGVMGFPVFLGAEVPGLDTIL